MNPSSKMQIFGVLGASAPPEIMFFLIKHLHFSPNICLKPRLSTSSLGGSDSVISELSGVGEYVQVQETLSRQQSEQEIS